MVLCQHFMIKAYCEFYDKGILRISKIQWNIEFTHFRAICRFYLEWCICIDEKVPLAQTMKVYDNSEPISSVSYPSFISPEMRPYIIMIILFWFVIGVILDLIFKHLANIIITKSNKMNKLYLLLTKRRTLFPFG